MVRQHPWLNRREFDESPGDSEGQGRLECCSPWGCRVRQDLMTEQQQHQSKDTTTQMYKVEGTNFPLMDYIFFSSTRSCDCQKPLFLLKKTSYSLLLSSLLQIIKSTDQLRRQPTSRSISFALPLCWDTSRVQENLQNPEAQGRVAVYLVFTLSSG